MATNREKLKQVAGWIEPYRVTDGAKFRLKKIDPSDTRGLKADKKEAAERLSTGVQWLAAEQDKLYAQDRRSLLLIFQAMDAAGKDSTIKHVMTGVNPQGVQVVAFKQPSPEELDHDWMWRCYRHLPERGRIGIFNRSYYEEVLVVRVHQEILRAQKLPPECVGKNIFDQRLRDIAAIEDYLVRNGTSVLKFFLHVSRKEQKKRFLERLDEPSKNWKFSAADVKERVALERVHGRLRGRHSRDRNAARAVVRRAGGQQMVHAPGRGRRDRRGARKNAAQVSDDRPDAARRA